MTDMLQRLRREEDGQDLLEYALIAGLISLTLVAVILGFGNSVLSLWDAVEAGVADAAAAV